jgi:hypothetical protein
MSQAGETRLKWFRMHLLGYGVVTASLAAVNLFWLTGEPWFMVFMVGWGAPLAGHCAFAMGLFGRWRT